jgi:putative DNA primase/helicase
MARQDDWFSDQTILGVDDRQAQELLAGVWIYEVAELAGMRRTEVERVKSFVSRTVERARGAYEREKSNQRRRGIMVGTTNSDAYLKSPNGNRRVWPVKTGTVDTKTLEADIDQLWAEAAMLEAEGEPLTLPRHLWTDAGAAQDERLERDLWEDKLEGVIYADIVYDAPGGGQEYRVSTAEILNSWLPKEGLGPAPVAGSSTS